MKKFYELDRMANRICKVRDGLQQKLDNLANFKVEDLTDKMQKLELAQLFSDFDEEAPVEESENLEDFFQEQKVIAADARSGGGASAAGAASSARAPAVSSSTTTTTTAAAPVTSSSSSSSGEKVSPNILYTYEEWQAKMNGPISLWN